MFPQLQNALRENKLFDKVKESDLNFHVSLENLLDRKAGEIIYKEGDSGGCVYVVIAGSVAIDKTHLLGRSKKTIVSADDFFGEEDYLEDMPRTSTAYALEDSTIIRLEGDILCTLCTDSQQFYCNVRRIPNESQEISSQEIESSEDESIEIDYVENEFPACENTVNEITVNELSASECPMDDLPAITFALDEVSASEVAVIETPINEIRVNEGHEDETSVKNETSAEYEISVENEISIFNENTVPEPFSNEYFIEEPLEEQQILGQTSSENEIIENDEGFTVDMLNSESDLNTSIEDEQDEKLPVTERVTSMDQMVNSLIQNIKKPVLVSKRYAEHLKTKDLSPDAAQIADMLLEQLNHVSDLVQTTLSFSEDKTVLNCVKCKLNETLDAVFDKLGSNNFNRNWEIVKQYDKDVNVNLDRGEFYKCCMHIVRNAYDAMPDGGRIFVTTKKRKNFVDISFKDSGSGIHESVKNKIFEPFMSYGKTRGTGLGLAVTRKIIEGHGGTISAQSIPGEGATFTITIPSFKE